MHVYMCLAPFSHLVLSAGGHALCSEACMCVCVCVPVATPALSTTQNHARSSRPFVAVFIQNNRASSPDHEVVSLQPPDKLLSWCKNMFKQMMQMRQFHEQLHVEVVQHLLNLLLGEVIVQEATLPARDAQFIVTHNG